MSRYRCFGLSVVFFFCIFFGEVRTCTQLVWHWQLYSGLTWLLMGLEPYHDAFDFGMFTWFLDLFGWIGFSPWAVGWLFGWLLGFVFSGKRKPNVLVFVRRLLLGCCAPAVGRSGIACCLCFVCVPFSGAFVGVCVAVGCVCGSVCFYCAAVWDPFCVPFLHCPVFVDLGVWDSHLGPFGSWHDMFCWGVHNNPAQAGCLCVWILSIKVKLALIFHFSRAGEVCGQWPRIDMCSGVCRQMVIPIYIYIYIF